MSNTPAARLPGHSLCPANVRRRLASGIWSRRQRIGFVAVVTQHRRTTARRSAGICALLRVAVLLQRAHGAQALPPLVAPVEADALARATAALAGSASAPARASMASQTTSPDSASHWRWRRHRTKNAVAARWHNGFCKSFTAALHRGRLKSLRVLPQQQSKRLRQDRRRQVPMSASLLM